MLCKLNQAVTPTVAAVPDVVSVLKQSIITPGLWYSAVALPIVLLYSSLQSPPEALCFYLEGPTVHLHSLA